MLSMHQKTINQNQNGDIAIDWIIKGMPRTAQIRAVIHSLHSETKIKRLTDCVEHSYKIIQWLFMTMSQMERFRLLVSS